MENIKISREEFRKKENEVIEKLENELREKATEKDQFNIIIFSMQNLMVLKELEKILFGKEEK